MPATAEEQARALVAAVRDDPAGRVALASRFYDRRARGTSIRSFRRAEIAFMRRQLNRGVLAAPDSDRPGSAWWRAVNERLLVDAWQAERHLSGEAGSSPAGMTPAIERPSVRRWVSFLRRPSAESWYRAHNASVVGGYIAHRDLAQLEHPLERFFMDVALVRVLFAECLLTAPHLVLGRCAPAGRVLADPRWRGANVFLSLRNILPTRYPLDGLTLPELLESENYLGCLVDFAIILPRIRVVYERAAATLEEPGLMDMLRDDAPVYAWPYEDRAVWTTTRAPCAIRAVRRLTSRQETQ